MGSKIAADAAIVGGGIIGCAIALRLAQAGLKVAVLDRGGIGEEASRFAAGMIAPHGETTEADDFSELCAASRDLYPDFAAEIEDLSESSVDYRRDGTLVLAVSEQQDRELNATYEWQTRQGVPLERLSGDQARWQIAGLGAGVISGLFVPGDHWVDTEKLIAGVIEAGRRRGVAFYPHTPVARIEVEQGLATRAVAENGGEVTEISAPVFIVAAGAWSQNLARDSASVPVVPCRGQLIECGSHCPLPFVVRAGHHYLVPRSDGRVVLGCTAEYVGYRKEVTMNGLSSIIAGVAQFAPSVSDFLFRRAWSAFRPDTPDHRPILGNGDVENVIFATGHFRNGILLAPITAQLISDLVLKGTTKRPLGPYRPQRFAMVS
jgi:glycine oxidase